MSCKVTEKSDNIEFMSLKTQEFGH